MIPTRPDRAQVAKALHELALLFGKSKPRRDDAADESGEVVDTEKLLKQPICEVSK